MAAAAAVALAAAGAVGAWLAAANMQQRANTTTPLHTPKGNTAPHVITVHVTTTDGGGTTVGQSGRYGRFTSVDRLERCRASATRVYCTAGPSGEAVRLDGHGATYVGVRDSADEGGPAMAEGTSLTTPNGRFECKSSYRGIGCTDHRTGESFVIGDYSVLIDGTQPSATGTYDGLFTSVDRRERCYATAQSVRCSSGISGQAVELFAGGSVSYLGTGGSADHGGPAMPEQTSFRTPQGAISCGSSGRGITCTDLATGNYFVIGDTQVIVNNGGGETTY